MRITHKLQRYILPSLGRGLGVGLLLCVLCVACSDDDDSSFPNLLTEMVDCPTDAQGTINFIVLDNDTKLFVTNPQKELKKNVTYRCLADYALEDDGKVTLYGLKGCPVLRDSTDVAQFDPVNVVSLWQTSRYINLHLMPKTQGQGEHGWGFIADSIVGRHAYLRLHHRQGNDPTSYSTDLYASLPLDLVEADTITLSIRTFSGTKDFSFPQ